MRHAPLEFLDDRLDAAVELTKRRAYVRALAVKRRPDMPGELLVKGLAGATLPAIAVSGSALDHRIAQLVEAKLREELARRASVAAYVHARASDSIGRHR